ncbi:pyruvate formate lyase family protein [Shigella flexneri]
MKPPVCTERAQHYTEVSTTSRKADPGTSRAGTGASPGESHHLDKTRPVDHWQTGKRSRTAPIYPEYTVSWIQKEIDDLADRPGAGFAVSEKNKRVLHEVCPGGAVRPYRIAATACLPKRKRSAATGIIKAEGNMTSGDAHLAVEFPAAAGKRS